MKALRYVNSFTVFVKVSIDLSNVTGCGFDIECELDTHHIGCKLLCIISVVLRNPSGEVFTCTDADLTHVEAEVFISESQFEENVWILTGECKDDFSCGSICCKEANLLLVFIILDAVTVTIGFPFGVPVLDSPIDAFLISSE